MFQESVEQVGEQRRVDGRFMIDKLVSDDDFPCDR